MQFKLDYSVQSLMLTPEGVLTSYPVRFEFGGPHDVLVTVRPVTAEEVEQGHDRDVGICEATIARELPRKVEPIFVDLEAGRLPEGSTPDHEAGYWDAAAQTLKPNQIPPLAILPRPFQAFASDVFTELVDYLRRTVRVMRWRTNQEGPHSPFAHRGVYWSRDGNVWHHMPTNISMRLSERGSLTLWDDVVADVQRIVAGGGDEPFEHELLREAWLLRSSNPRSALLLGVAAAEVAIKTFVGNRLPPAAWLVRELPAPPIVRMYREYLPTLEPVAAGAPRPQAPPKDLLDALNKGVGLRNALVHRGGVEVDIDDAEPLLEAVDELLWLLRYWSGVTWALDHVSRSTRIELGYGDEE